MINYKFYTVAICLLLILGSCKSSYKSYKDDVVSLYDGQAYLMNGTYFIDPYYHNDEYVELQELFDIENTNKFLEKLKLEFLSDQKLKITYSNGLEAKTKIVKGEMSKGGFQIDQDFFVFGIPWVLFSYKDERKIFYLGNDDNLIYQHYYKSAGHLFGRINTKKINEIVKFDRQLPKRP